MVLRRGKGLQPIAHPLVKAKEIEDVSKEIGTQTKQEEKVKSNLISPASSNTCVLPPCRMAKSKKEHEKEILEIFKNVGFDRKQFFLFFMLLLWTLFSRKWKGHA